MRNAMLLAAGLAASLAAVAAFGKDTSGPSEVDIPTARGAKLKAVVHRGPNGNGAAVVLAPGQGYHKDLPLIRRGAEALAEAGFVAVRFDWAYFTEKGQAADDLATEVADLDAAVAFAKKLEGVTKVLVAGKSLGSLAALRWGEKHKGDAAGFALLTFPLNSSDDPTEVSARALGFEKLGDRALIVVGDRDPICDLQLLYRALSAAGSRQQVVVVPGDHGLSDGTKDSPETAENVDLAVRHLVVWAKRRITD